jgi:hypothetical protein
MARKRGRLRTSVYQDRGNPSILLRINLKVEASPKRYISSRFLTLYRGGVGRSRGGGRGLGVTRGVAVGVGVALGVGVTHGGGVGVGVGGGPPSPYVRPTTACRADVNTQF